MTDIVIPLSSESKADNMELRLALRSIARYARNLGTVHIVTDSVPKWLTNVNIIEVSDTYKDNKDANLFTKMIAAAEHPKVSEHFIFWSDDQVLTDYLDLDEAPVISNPRGYIDFDKGDKLTEAEKIRWKWYRRMCNTMRYLNAYYGFEMNHNYDSHCPQPYEKSKVLDIFKSAPFQEQPGFCIDTLYYGTQKDVQHVTQKSVKVNFEKDELKIPRELKLYLGYNDAGFSSGLMLFLLGMFYEPCRYEKE